MNKKGFTLVEVLITIAVSMLVLSLGIVLVNKIIEQSQQKSETIAHENIKKGANLYSKEFYNDFIWTNNKSCITVEELVAKGYIEKEKIKDATHKYVIVEKDDYNTILSETTSDGKDDVCNAIIYHKAPLPTSEKICNNNLEYNASPLNLINKDTIDIYYQVEDIYKKDAGSYQVAVELNEEYSWQDNSRGTKTVYCRIKKATPKIDLESNTSEENYKNQTITTKLASNIPGTIELKSSNPKYATASFKEVENSSEYIKEIIINNHAKRQTSTYITITFKPEDSKNYNTHSEIYTLGNIDSISINKPTNLNSFCNKNMYYDGNEKKLTTTSGGEGYLFINNTATDIGKHQVTIKLNEGLKWSDGKTNDITFECEIKAPTYTIQYLGNGNTGGSTKSSVHTYNEGKALTTNGFTKTDYTFMLWNTKADGTGTNYSNNEIVSNLSKINDDIITLYAQWKLEQSDTMDTPNGTYYCTEKTISQAIFMSEKKEGISIMGELLSGKTIILNNNIPFCFNQMEVVNLVKSDCSSFLSEWPFASAYVHKSYISDINKVKSENIYGDYVFGYIPLQNLGTCLTTLGCPGIDQFKQRWCS